MRLHTWGYLRTRPMNPTPPEERPVRRRCAACDCVLASDNKADRCSPCGGVETWEGVKPGRGRATNREILAMALLTDRYEVDEDIIRNYKDARSCRSCLQSSIAWYGLPLRARVEGERVYIVREAPLEN